MLIIPEYLFEMETGKFGRIRVRDLSVGAVTEIRKRVPDYDKRPGKDITVASASVLGLDNENRPIDGAQLSEKELTEFAVKLLEALPRIVSVDEPIDESPRKEKENFIDSCGRTIAVEINSFDGGLIEKSGVKNAMRELNKISDMVNQSARLSRFSGLASAADNMRSALKDMGLIATLDSQAMKGYHYLEEQRKLVSQKLEDSNAVTAQFKPPFGPVTIPTLPPNPIYETNERLGNMAAKVEIFTGTLTGHIAASALALKDVAEQIEESSKNTAKQNNIMIGLTVLSVLVAIVTAYVGYTMGKSASEKTQPPAVVAPAEGRSRPVHPKKTTKEMKAPHSTPDTKQRN